MKFCNTLMAVSVAIALSACGGGDTQSASPQAPSLLASFMSSDTTVTTVNAKGEKVVLDTNNPPDMTGPSFESDMKRMRAKRMEKWKKGDALERAQVPEDKKAKRPPKFLAGSGTSAKLAAPGLAIGQTVKVAPDPTNIPANAGTMGMWSAVYDWPVIPIHMSMMPDGRLMSFGTDGTGKQGSSAVYAIFDPSLGLFDGHMTLPNGTNTDIFCSVTVLLPTTDQLLVVGGDVLDPATGYPKNVGHNGTSLFSEDNSLVRGNNMNRPRWYASTVTMTNGEIFVMGGLGGADRPEMRSTAGVYRLLGTADTSRLDYWYPHNWLAPDGRVFGYDSYGNYYFVNTAGTGAVQIVNQWDVNRFGETGTAVMYRPGQILQIAGYGKGVSLIDIRGTTPTMTPLADLPIRRQDANATVLPNGKVLLTGGSELYNDRTRTSNQASTWDPVTRAWTQGAAGTMDRLYHSVGMLMTDGTVLVGGGGAWGPLNNLNVEFYYPQYLFNANGTLATRPTISAAATATSVGQTFNMTVSSDVTKVTLVKAGSVTHSWNNEQNFHELSFTRAGNVLTVTMPTSAINAPPGMYMVFALNAQGTPSLARMVKVGSPVVAPAPPSNMTGTFRSGSGVTLNWTQSASGGVTQNIISRGTAAAGPFTTIATVTARTTYLDPMTTAGTYYYNVKAVNGNGTSLASNTVPVTVTSVVTPPVEPPTGIVTPPQGAIASPTGLSGYTCGAGCWSTDTGVRFNWTQSGTSSVTGYHVRRSTGSVTGPWTTVASLGKVSGYVDKNVTAGITYYYSVTAVNATASSAWATLGYGVTSNITLTVTPPPPPPTGNKTLTLNSQGETRYMVMNWWRGDPATEGNFRQPGICTGIPPAGNCYLGARKTFRPQGFYVQNTMLWLEVPQYDNGVNTFDHYPLPIELVKTGCTFSVRHVRTHSALEFPLNPPGLEILPHAFTMSQALCDGYDPASPTWLADLNAALDAMLGADPYPYTPTAYPYNDPRTGKDPSQP